MSPDFSQPIANITYYRPHGLINILSNKQPLFPDHGPRLTLPKLPREPTGCASPGAAGGTQHPSPCPSPCHALLSYCVLCFAIFVIRYPRTKTYKPRGRASDVSTISTCFSLCYNILPTPPPISVRTAGGITVVYLCGFSPFMLNYTDFFQKSVSYHSTLTIFKICSSLAYCTRSTVNEWMI